MKNCTVAIILLLAFCAHSFCAQKLIIESSDKKNLVGLYLQGNGTATQYFLKVSRADSGKINEVIPQIILGLKEDSV